MNHVLVYREEILPLSETFIRAQVLALRRWRATLVGMRRAAAGLDLTGLKVRCLREQDESRFARWGWHVAQRTGFAGRMVARGLAALQPQLLHVHFGTDAAAMWPVFKRLTVPVVVTLHGYDISTHRDWWEAGHRGRMMRRYPQRLLAMAQDPRVAFIAVSHVIRERAIEFGIPAEKVEVLHIGIDRHSFAPPLGDIAARSPQVLFIGRLVEKKGCAILIRAMQRVAAAVPKAGLVVVGDGPLRPACEVLAASLGVAVEFRGAATGAEVRSELARSRVLCTPSVRAGNGDAEGMPLVLLEAQASGVPVVASGHADEALIHGTTGFAFEEANEAELAAHLTRLLCEPDLLRHMSARAVEFVAQKYDLDACTQRLASYYDRRVAPH